MKFRYKVLIINMLLLSAVLLAVGYVILKRSYELALDTQIENAVLENNLAEASIEYSLLSVINSPRYNLDRELDSISGQVYAGMMSDTSDLIILYSGNQVFSSEENIIIPDDLILQVDNNIKNYIITEEDGKLFIYIASFCKIDKGILNIITRRDITGLKRFVKKSINDYRSLSLIILTFATLIIYIISYFLTRPLEKLNKVTDAFAKGSYSERSDIKGHDEVALLSDKFNQMADSVETHIGELNDMIKRRDQFVADFTHEIKTPMTAIIGYADTLRSMELSEKERLTALNYIFSEGKRLEDMSMKLFDLIYLKSNAIEKKPIPAVSLGNDIVNSVKPLLLTDGITLKHDFEQGIIAGDRELLKTVFINLIDNARKASSKGSEVIFKGNKKDNLYYFTVQDFGVGIKEKDLNRICDEFYMVDKSRSRKKGGAGLGLSLASLILNKHEAVMKIESTPNVGTTFNICFKLSEEVNGKNNNE